MPISVRLGMEMCSAVRVAADVLGSSELKRLCLCCRLRERACLCSGYARDSFERDAFLFVCRGGAVRSGVRREPCAACPEWRRAERRASSQLRSEVRSRDDARRQPRCEVAAAPPPAPLRRLSSGLCADEVSFSRRGTGSPSGP